MGRLMYRARRAWTALDESGAGFLVSAVIVVLISIWIGAAFVEAADRQAEINARYWRAP